MQHEILLVGALQAVDKLLVLAGAQRGHHQRLGFAAGEQRRAVSTRQHAHFRQDRTHGDEVAPVDALLGVEHRAAHHMGFQIVHQGGELGVVEFAFAGEFRSRLGPNFLDAIAAHVLFRNLEGL